MAKVNPIQLQKALKGVDYPASKQDLQKAAEANGADDNVRDMIEKLKEDHFNKPSDVSKAVGELE